MRAVVLAVVLIVLLSAAAAAYFFVARNKKELKAATFTEDDYVFNPNVSWETYWNHQDCVAEPSDAKRKECALKKETEFKDVLREINLHYEAGANAVGLTAKEVVELVPDPDDHPDCAGIDDLEEKWKCACAVAANLKS